MGYHLGCIGFTANKNMKTDRDWSNLRPRKNTEILDDFGNFHHPVRIGCPLEQPGAESGFLLRSFLKILKQLCLNFRREIQDFLDRVLANQEAYNRAITLYVLMRHFSTLTGHLSKFQKRGRNNRGYDDQPLDVAIFTGICIYIYMDR